MKCWRCDNIAEGICRFCGRGVCQEHTSEMVFIFTIYVGDRHTPKAVVVPDALYCGICQPEPEPIEMPEIY